MQVIVAESYGGEDEPVDSLVASLVGVDVEVRIYPVGLTPPPAAQPLQQDSLQHVIARLLPITAAEKRAHMHSRFNPINMQHSLAATTGEPCCSSGLQAVLDQSYRPPDRVFALRFATVQLMGDALRIKETPTTQLYQQFEEAGTDLAQVRVLMAGGGDGGQGCLRDGWLFTGGVIDMGDYGRGAERQVPTWHR